VDGLLLLGLARKVEGDYPIGAAESYSIMDVAKMFGGPVSMLPARDGNRHDTGIDTSAITSLGWKQKRRLEDYVQRCGNERPPLPTRQESIPNAM